MLYRVCQVRWTATTGVARHTAARHWPMGVRASRTGAGLVLLGEEEHSPAPRHMLLSRRAFTTSQGAERADRGEEQGADIGEEGVPLHQSFAFESAAQDVQAELNRLFGLSEGLSPTAAPSLTTTGLATPQPQQRQERPPPLSLSLSLSPPPRASSRDLEEEVGERPRPYTRRPLVLTVERQHRPLPSPTLPAVPPILTRSQWPGVVHQRYHEAVPVAHYVPECRRLVSACLTFLDAPRHRVEELQRHLDQLHSDALLCVIEVLLSTDSVKNAAASELLLRVVWELLSSPLSGRSLELPSKQLVRAMDLFQLAVAQLPSLPRSCLYNMVYPSRKSLRRWQNTRTLELLLRYPPPSTEDREEESVVVYGACLNHCVARCLERGKGPDPSHVGRVLQSALTLGWAYLHPVVRQAGLRGVLSRLRQGPSGDKRRRSGRLPSYLNGVMRQTASDSPAAPVFAQLEAALADTDGFAVPALEQRMLRARQTRTMAEPVGDLPLAWHPLSLSDQCPSLSKDITSLVPHPPHDSPSECERFLAAVGRTHADVSALSDLPTALSLVKDVRSSFAPLAAVLLVRILFLALPRTYFRGEEAGVGEDGTAAPQEDALHQQTLSAVLTLLPLVSVAELVDVLVALAPHEEAGRSAAFLESLVRCVAYHVPSSVVPTVLASVVRAREAASLPMLPFALKLLTTIVETLPLDALSAADALLCRSFVQDEKRREDFTGFQRTSGPLLSELSQVCSLRSRRGDESTGGPLASPDGCRGGGGGGGLTQTMAIHELFGYSSVTERTVLRPEVVRGCQTALAWLYYMHSISHSLSYEVQVLAQLATAQGVSLGLSECGERLVHYSEDNDGAMTPLLLWRGEDAELRAWLGARQAPGRSCSLPLPTHLLSPPSAMQSEPQQAAPVLRSFSFAEDGPVYVDALTREASWKCLSFYLNATLLEQAREKPDPRFPSIARRELCRQLSLGDAADALVRYFFLPNVSKEGGDSEEAGATTTTAIRVPAARDVRPLLAMYEEYLSRQHPDTFPHNKNALLSWTRSATCACLVEVLSVEVPGKVRDGDQPPVPLRELVDIYKHMLLLTRDGGTARPSHQSDQEDAHRRYPPPLPRLPPSLHVKMLSAVCDDAALWDEALPLLELLTSLAASGTCEVPVIPSRVYRVVMQSCLMHRTTVPDFIRARASE